MTWQSTGIGFGAPLVAAAVPYLMYRRSKHVDEISEQSGIVTETRAGTQQIIDELNRIIDTKQEDEVEFRAQLRECSANLKAANQDYYLRLDVVCRERDQLRRELNRMYRKYGENGGTPPRGVPQQT